MVTSFAVLTVLALAPAQEGGKLEIVNARPTFGYLGPARPRTGILPGDVAHFRFDVKNMALDKKGRASYSLLVQVTDAKGKTRFRLGPTNAVALNCLGGDTMPCSASMEIPLDTPPGPVKLKVLVKDRVSGRQATFEGKGKVLKPGFGLVRVGAFADPEGKVPAPGVGVVGEVLYVGFAAVGFARGEKTGQPDLAVSLRVLDAKGKETMPAPLTGRASADVPEDMKILPMQFGLTLNRAGQFTVELSARDQVSGRMSQVRFPLRVVEYK
jgi:hypothetical protein